MKKTITRVLALTVVMMIVLLSFPAGVFADVENSEPSREFNIFLDAGEITDEFISQTSQIIAENWSDDYFSSITMTLGEDVMLVDGEEVELSVGAFLNKDDDLFLPVAELAETMGATVEINQQSGDILVETPEGQINLNSFADDKSLANSPEQTQIGEAVTEEDNGNTTMYTDEDSALPNLTAIQEEQAEELFCLDISLENNKVIITRPYQLKEIFLFVNNGGILNNNHQAKNSVTNDEGLYFLQYETEEQTRIAYESFISDSEIKCVALNHIVTTDALPSPGSWGTNGNANSMGIQADRMKNYLQDNDEEIIVAVLDTGVDSEYLPGTENGRDGHPHLEGRTTLASSAADNTAGYNFIDNNNNPYDVFEHGTHVAGTIVDCTPENVKILPVKVLDDNGRYVGTGDSFSVFRGINYAVEQGAQVINMSIGYPECKPDKENNVVCLIEHAISAARTTALENNKTPPVFVVSAGNDGSDVGTKCPAKHSLDFDNIITVGAVDQNDLIARFSNSGNAVDVCAPGFYIYSSVPGGEYGYNSGTSMAAPHVSAAVAMLKLAFPNYTAFQLKNTLKSMVVDLGVPGEDYIYGAGRIDFRMLDIPGLSVNSLVAATSVEIRQILLDGSSVTCDSIELSYGTIAEDYRFSAIVLPKECTDKSVTITSDNSSVVSCQNGLVIPGSPGSATLGFYKTGFTSRSIPVTIYDNWINHAASHYAGGNGMETNPFLISNAAQLAKLAYETRINNRPYPRTYFKLTNDIDLAGYEWVPIGSIDYIYYDFLFQVTSFKGVFDGAGYAIKNMTLNGLNCREWEYLGLFGLIKGDDNTSRKAEIKNLAITDANVIGVNERQNRNTGILCGVACYTNISNCYIQGVTTGSGLIGNMLYDSTIKDCYTNVEAGLAGLVHFNNLGHIVNSYASGVAAQSGVVDTLHSSAVTNSFFITTKTGLSQYGFAQKNNQGSINNCYFPSVYSGSGVNENISPVVTDLTSKPVSFFADPSTYTNEENWDSSYPWDFENIWNIDANYQGGLPYLRAFQRLCSTIPIESLVFENTEIGTKQGTSFQLNANILPSNATNKALLWHSSSPNIISVDANGMVTAIASSGSSVITASAIDGSGIVATCTVYIDDHNNDTAGATTVTLHSKTAGSINYSTDEDWFGFTPTTSGSYLFYTTGSTDTKGTLYNSSGAQLKVNNNGSISGSNFAFAYSLTAGQTYYIKVSNNNSSTGAYTLNVSKSFYSASYTNTNADARKVQMSAEAASVLTNLTITINGTTYSLTKPTSGDLDKTVNGVRFKVTFTSKNSGLSTLWNITANIPATAIGSTTTTKFTFSKGIVTGISSSNLTGLVAYGSSYKTSLTPNTYLSSLLSSMATSGYTFTAYNWNDQQITATTTTKVATGQKIVQKNSSGKIVHVYYLVLFGDVAGSGVVGDGLINATDSMKVLQEIAETFLGEISKLAADADHNGSISQADADLILNHAVGNATINQNVAITQVVYSSCYFQSSVTF